MSENSSKARVLNEAHPVRFSFRMWDVVDYSHDHCPACSQHYTDEGLPCSLVHAVVTPDIDQGRWPHCTAAKFTKLVGLAQLRMSFHAMSTSVSVDLV